MNRTTEQQCPFEWLEQEPEERKYWRANMEILPEVLPRFNGLQYAYTSERAAWIKREKVLLAGTHCPAGPIYEITKQEIIDVAISIGAHTVQILDENMTIVEEWPL